MSEQQLAAENAKLREQVEVLTNALAEAMVICAKWSPGGPTTLRALAAQEMQARLDGQIASLRGFTPEANPHRHNTPEHRSWHRGFRELPAPRA